MKPPTTPLDLREWLALISAGMDRMLNERRDAARWSGVALTALITVIAFFLDSLGKVTYSLDLWLVAVLMGLSAYLLARIVWEPTKYVAQTIALTLVSQKRQRPSAAEILDLISAQSRPTAVGALRAHMQFGILATFALWIVWWVASDSVIKSAAFAVAAFRSGIFVVSAALFYRTGSGSENLQNLGALRTVIPDRARPKFDALLIWTLENAEQIGSAIVISGYVFQLWLFSPTLQLMVTPNLEAVKAMLLLLVAFGLLFWIREIGWPMIRLLSNQFQSLLEVQGMIVAGQYSDSGELFQSLLDQAEGGRIGPTHLAAIGDSGSPSGTPRLELVPSKWIGDRLLIRVAAVDSTAELNPADLTFLVRSKNAVTLFAGAAGTSAPIKGEIMTLVYLSSRIGRVSTGDSVLFAASPISESLSPKGGSLMVFLRGEIVGAVKELPSESQASQATSAPTEHQ